MYCDVEYCVLCVFTWYDIDHMCCIHITCVCYMGVLYIVRVCGVLLFRVNVIYDVYIRCKLYMAFAGRFVWDSDDAVCVMVCVGVS